MIKLTPLLEVKIIKPKNIESYSTLVDKSNYIILPPGDYNIYISGFWSGSSYRNDKKTNKIITLKKPTKAYKYKGHSSNALLVPELKDLVNKYIKKDNGHYVYIQPNLKLNEVKIISPNKYFIQTDLVDIIDEKIYSIEVKFNGDNTNLSFFGELNLHDNTFIFYFNDFFKKDNIKYENLIHFFKTRKIDFESSRDNTGKYIIIDPKFINLTDLRLNEVHISNPNKLFTQETYNHWLFVYLKEDNDIQGGYDPGNRFPYVIFTLDTDIGQNKLFESIMKKWRIPYKINIEDEKDSNSKREGLDIYYIHYDDLKKYIE